MKSRTFVYLSYYFPPLAGMGSARASRFVRHLPETGWRPLVVTPEAGMYHRGPSSWTPPEGVELVRTPSLELSRLFRRAAFGIWGGPGDSGARGSAAGDGGAGEYWSGDSHRGEGEELRPVRTGPLGNTLRGLVRDLAYVPDAQIGWFPYALSACRRLDEVAPTLVFSSSVPYTAHLVAMKLAAEKGFPWVAEFRDLWSQSQAELGRSSWRRALDLRLEAEVLKAASKVVVTTETSRRRLLERWDFVSPDRVVVVTNSTESAGVEPHGAQSRSRRGPPPPDEPLLLVHAGTLLPDLQNPEPLLEAIGRINGEGPPRVRMVALGPREPWAVAARRVGLLPESLELRGVVAPAEVSRALATASAVVVLAPGSRFDAVLLGKSLEWLGSGRPVLGLVGRGGEMDRLFSRAGAAFVVHENQNDTIGLMLDRMLRLHEDGDLQGMAPKESVVEEFAAERTSGRLAGVFASAVDGGARP